MKVLHPIRSYRNFKARFHANVEAVCAFCLASLEAVRALTASINAYDLRVTELHGEIKKIETSVNYLHRVERHNREARGQKVNV